MPLIDFLAAWFDALAPVNKALVLLACFGLIVAIFRP
jgi:hypothetical protein